MGREQISSLILRSETSGLCQALCDILAKKPQGAQGGGW